MLSIAAAVLTTTVLTTTVLSASALVVPVPIPGVEAIGSSVTVALAQPTPDTPPVAGPAPIGGVEAGMLAQLTAVPAGGIADFLLQHTDAVPAVLADPPAPVLVSTWWRSLDPAQRAELGEAAPVLVGNLEGLPYPVRDVANQRMLRETITSLERAVDDGAGRAIIDRTRQQLSMLRSIDEALHADADRTLLTLDVEGQGRAAIVIGDLRTADYVSYLVPGMFFTIENQMGDWVDAAQRLHGQQLDWLRMLRPGSGASVATIAWIGYHTPNLTNIGSLDNARPASVWLQQSLSALRDARAGDQPYLSIVAHSYGSTAALMALTDGDVEVDALALVGSPGSSARSASELHVRDGAVYVGEASWDPVPNSSYFGSDPGSAEYGAIRMGVDGGVDAITGQTLRASMGHNDYFSPDTEAMRNFALIAIGEGRFVSGVGGGTQ